MAVQDLNERARERIRVEKAARKLSERELADLLQWSQSKVAQKLSGRTPMTLDELDALCFAVGIAPSEAVRDHGLEFCSEMTPTELRTLQQLRRLPSITRDAIMHLVDVKTKTRAPERHARPLQKRDQSVR